VRDSGGNVKTRVFKFGSHSIEHLEVRPGVWRQNENPNVQKYIFLCQDCEGQPDHFMLRHDLWFQTCPDNGVICFRCLESRLGRPLEPSDLIDFDAARKLPINRPIYMGFQMGMRAYRLASHSALTSTLNAEANCQTQ
jgi:hypothetical protein